MKQIFVFLVFACAFSVTAQAQADQVVGYWLTDGGESQIKVFKAADGKFYGNIVWLKEPNENGKAKVDDDNPDEKLRSRPLLNLQILKGFSYDTDDQEWTKGKIYDPKTGSTYSCYMWFEDNNTNTLFVKGFIGVSLIGKSTKWTREQTQRKM